MRTKKRIYTVKLKHLDLISSVNPDYPAIMKQVFGYTNNWLTRRFNFVLKFNRAYLFVRGAQQINPLEQEFNPNSKIQKPQSIDNISFRAMLEVQAIIGNGAESGFMDLIADIIAAACFQANVEEDYDSECNSFKEFKQSLYEQPLTDMLGLYNWIHNSLIESDKIWNERFLSVEVQDPDYEKAAGQRMNQFNVINSIKMICEDFNISYEKAWQISYATVQTNSYSKATASHIQEQMRIVKEARMRAERGSKST